MSPFAKYGIVPTIKGAGMVIGRQKPLPGEPWPETKSGSKDGGFILWLQEGSK